MTQGPQRAAGIRRGAALVLGLLLVALAAGAASASAATVSGFVRTAEGDPVAGVVLDVNVQRPFRTVASATTALDGSYAFTVADGGYQLAASLPDGADPVPGLPAQWSVSGVFDVSGDGTMNLVLPAVRTLTVRVLDSRDVPQEGFTVSLPGLRSPVIAGSNVRVFSSVPDAVTDAAGEVHAPVFDGSSAAGFNGTGSLTPPDGGGFLPSTFGMPAISGETTLVLHAAEPSTHVTGVVRDADGNPVPGVALTLGPAGAVTDAAGAYSLGVEPGTYGFHGSMSEGGTALGLPDSWYLNGTLSVTADRTFDITLPQAVTLTTRVLDAADGDAPLEGTLVDLPSLDLRDREIGGESGFTIGSSAPQGTTDADGEAHALLFGGEAHFAHTGTVTPPESTGYAPADLLLPTLDGDTTVVERVPDPYYWVTGVVREGNGTALAGVTAKVGADSATTGLDGTWRLRVAPGGGRLELTMPEALAAGLPANWRLQGTFSAYADRPLDVTLPRTDPITVRVLGEQDEPVPDALLELPGFSFWTQLDAYGELTRVQLWSDPRSPTTDANGEALHAVFHGTQETFGRPSLVRPPADSGYGAQTFMLAYSVADPVVVVHVTDRAAPAIVFSQSPDGANGWWSGRPASVHVTASDPRIDTLACTVDGVAPRRLGLTSGAGTLEADLTIRDEGRHPIGCTATDRSANSTTETAAALIDLTNPNPPTLTADRAPDFTGVTGDWWADTVTVTATGAGDPLLADGSAGSGVDPGSVPAPQTFATSGRQVASASVSDVAGNVSRATRLTVRVDADAPTTTLRCPATVRLGARANASWDDADADSGLAGPNHGRVALDSSTLGTHSAEHTAADHVGHATTSSCSYTVV